jgi:hypothetical protein
MKLLEIDGPLQSVYNDRDNNAFFLFFDDPRFRVSCVLDSLKISNEIILPLDQSKIHHLYPLKVSDTFQNIRLFKSPFTNSNKHILSFNEYL